MTGQDTNLPVLPLSSDYKAFLQCYNLVLFTHARLFLVLHKYNFTVNIGCPFLHYTFYFFIINFLDYILVLLVLSLSFGSTCNYYKPAGRLTINYPVHGRREG